MGGFGGSSCGGLFGGGMGGLGLLGGLFSLLVGLALVAGVVLLVVWLARRPTGGTRALTLGPRPGEVQSPRDLAALRYARGEITREQYQQILADLAS